MRVEEQLFADARAEARPYQLRLVRKAIDMFRGRHVNRTGDRERAANSVLIEAPTGSGKTIVALAVALWMQQAWGFRVGWVAMRRNLLAQAAEENIRRGFGVGMRLISMFDKQPPPVDLLVVDEAQHDGAMSMANLHGVIRPQKILGLSATPYRSDRIKLCFEQVIRDADIHSLVQQGYLSPYRHYTIPRYAPEEVAAFYGREPQRWGKSLVFFFRLSECETCRRLLEEKGIRCEVVTGASDRQRQIEDFFAGRIEVLLSMLILAEGFDCASLETVFCRPSGRGPTIQMCGRVFRRHPAIPFKQIVQCQHTRYPFPRAATPAEQLVWTAESWRTLGLNRNVAAISSRIRKALAASSANLPKLIADNQPTWRDWRRIGVELPR